MAITIKGIRLEDVNLIREDKSGKLELKSATYCLISSADCVLASQGIGGYNDKVKISPSGDTLKFLNQFVNSYKKDISTILGLEEA